MLILAAFALAFAAVAALSAWRLEYRGLARTREERVVEEISRMRGVRAEAIVLADSVTAGPMFAARPAQGVIPMPTSGYMRLAGQYLLMGRFLEHNSTRRMYLFMYPKILEQDISDDEGGGLARYTYVDSLFARADEKRILEEAGAAPRRHIEMRFERLLKAWYPNRFPQPLTSNLIHIEPSSEPLRPLVDARHYPTLSRQIDYFMHRIEADCLGHAIDCVLVQAPTTSAVTRWHMPSMHKLFPGIRFIDFHDIASFPESGYFDGMHLDVRTSILYDQLIQAHVAPLFESRQLPWDGSKVAFSSEDTRGLFFSDSFHGGEPWGLWTSAATVDMQFRAATELRDGEIRIGVRLPNDLMGNRAHLVTVAFDGATVLQAPVSGGGGLHELVFRSPGGPIAAGSTHTIEIRMPKALNYKALGLGNDPRDLGIGLVYIAYCGPSHPCGG